MCARSVQVREGATTDLGGGGGEQRTSNIQLMSVTPEVSQLSGWLKAVADWRGSQAGHTVRGAGCGPQEAERGERLRCARSMQRRGRDSRHGRRGGGEQRAGNIKAMFVTRDVFQLSGWLKAVADWRGSQAGHTVRGAGCGPQEAERGERLRCACSMHRREGATTGLGGAGTGSSAR